MSSNSATTFERGTHLLICNLQNRPELNGLQGFIIDGEPLETGRFKVKLVKHAYIYKRGYTCIKQTKIQQK